MSAHSSSPINAPDGSPRNTITHLRWMLAPLLGGALFVLFTSLGMLFYTGGTFLDPSTTGYIFAQNFFSDLGRSVARTGGSNLGSQVCFAIAATSCGILLVPPFLVIPYLFPKGSRAWSHTRLSAILAVPAGLGYLLVGFAPADSMKFMHYGAMFLALILTSVVLLFYSFAILSVRHFPRRYAYLNFFVIGLIGFFLLYYAFGPPDTTLEGLIVRVVLQKVTIYGEILALGIQGVGAYRVGISLLHVEA